MSMPSPKSIEKLKATTPNATDERRMCGRIRSSRSFLTVRLAEATASRELLVPRAGRRSAAGKPRAKRSSSPSPTNRNGFIPFITHGYSPQESNELVTQIRRGTAKGRGESICARQEYGRFAFFAARSCNPLSLLIHPQSGAVLNDDSSLQPLLRVVELGMDVIALREKDKSDAGRTGIEPVHIEQPDARLYPFVAGDDRRSSRRFTRSARPT